MLEIIFTIVSTLVLYLISTKIEFINKYADSILDLLPVLPPMILYLIYKPQNYLKFLSCKKLNVRYRADIQISNSVFTESDFKNLEQRLIENTNSLNDRIIKSNYHGKYFDSELQIETNLIKLLYDKDGMKFLLNSESKMSYSSFINYIDRLLESINQFFQSQENIKYNKNDLKISISLNFIDDEGDKSESCRNPLWNKLFSEFENKTANLFYTAKKDTKVTLGNSNIDFINNDIKDIKSDIQSELKFFIFRK